MNWPSGWEPGWARCENCGTVQPIWSPTDQCEECQLAALKHLDSIPLKVAPFKLRSPNVRRKLLSEKPTLFSDKTTPSKTILSLCDLTGNWSAPYREAGYRVIQVDLQAGQDVRLLEYPGPVHGILAAPPCTAFAGSGARWWASKGEQALLDGLGVADACLRLVAICRPRWWALENPSGRLSRYYGKAAFSFDPCDFGDPYTKRTHLWGNFVPPMPLFIGGDKSVQPTEGSKMHMLPPTKDRANLRSATPKGFAQAFFVANP